MNICTKCSYANMHSTCTYIMFNNVTAELLLMLQKNCDEVCFISVNQLEKVSSSDW